MPTVIDKIIAWAKSLPYWEQAALQKIIDGVELKRTDYDELLQYLLEDTGLKEPSAERPTLNSSQKIEANVAQLAKRKHLKRIYRVQNINALAGNQELSFGLNLTVIYGNNGSGKSGYARIIGNTAFTRGDKQVLMDITKKYDPSLPQTVCFEFESDNEAYTVEHELGNPCSEMDMFHVFDSTSARVHLTKQNTLSFVPFGLQYLTQLAEVTDNVRDRLNKEVEKRQRPNHFLNHFREETEVKTLILDLGLETVVQSLRRLSLLSGEEVARLDQIDREITSLQNQNVEKEIQQIQLVISDLQKLVDTLKTLVEALGTERIQTINNRISEWHERNILVESLSREHLQTARGYVIGTPLWFEFVGSAHRLAMEGSSTEQSYPQTGDACLLCNQLLSPGAREHIERLWSLLESNAQTGLQNLEKQLRAVQNDLVELDLDFFNDQLVSYRHLESYDQNILFDIQKFLEGCAYCRQEILTAIAQRQKVVLHPVKILPLDKIDRIIEQLKTRMNHLQNADTKSELTLLKQEQLEFQCRQKLGELLPEIEEFVQNARWIAKAESPKTRRSTRHISQQFNSLFDELVTKRYIELFTEHLRLLNFPATILVNTRGRKGETLKQIVLKMDESVPSNQIQTDKVLSEGEQKAVALADFLTEVALDGTCFGIVLDDPVTSLDFHWKDLIAPILVEEANHRQVVIFTHDLHFLYCLKEAASKYIELDIAAHWIEKRNGVPGWVFENNTPLSEREYKTSNIAQQRLREAQEADPENQQRLLREGFGALRTSYEAFVIYELFGQVVMRFEERVSIDRLKNVYIDPEIRDKVIEKVGFLSRYIEGHLHSDSYIAQKPAPEDLKREISEFDELKGVHKAYQKERRTKA